MSSLVKKIQDSVNKQENMDEMKKVINNEVSRKYNKAKIKIMNAEEFYDNYDREDVNNSFYIHSLFNSLEVKEEPYAVIEREQLKYYQEYKNACNEVNIKIENIIREYMENYFNNILKYKKQALNEREN